MIRFAHPDALFLLALLPVLAAAFVLLRRRRRRALAAFFLPGTAATMVPAASTAKPVLKFGVLLLALGLLIVGLANPRIGTRLEEVEQKGVDIFIALDVSLSMKAEDMRPNRLEKARLEIRNLIRRLKGDRVGLIVFAGQAFTQFPLTTDYAAAGLFLDAVDVDVVPVQGTAIGSAIERAMESFPKDQPSTKVLVIITDGENTEGDAFVAAGDAAASGVLIYTIGMGSPSGSPIPLQNASGRQVDFKRDRAGAVVMTRLDEASLERIADIGRGAYFRGTSGQDELTEIYRSISGLEQQEFGTRQFTEYEDRFQVFLLAGLLLLAAELFLSERRTAWLARWDLLRRGEEVRA
jgi:Ca-activated chloride channel family protein